MKRKGFDLALLFGRKAANSTLLKAALAELPGNSPFTAFIQTTSWVHNCSLCCPFKGSFDTQ